MNKIKTMTKGNKDKKPRSKVAFTIEGKDLELDKISQSLGLEASHTHKLGELISEGRTRRYEHDMWSLESPFDPLEPIDKHLKWLAEHLRLHHAVIASLKDQAEVYIYCGYTFYDFESGFSLSPEALVIFTVFGIPMEVSLLIG